MFSAPIDVILSVEDIMQPDLVVVANGPQISARGIEGAPVILVEILSPSRPQYDRVTKGRRYAALGVPHYWIVDPSRRTVECFTLRQDTYHLEAMGAERDLLSVPSFDGLSLALQELWMVPPPSTVAR